MRHLPTTEPRPAAPKRPAPTNDAAKDSGSTRVDQRKPKPKPPPQLPFTPPLSLTHEANHRVAKIAERTGLRDDDIIKRVFGWLASQDEIVQAVALGQIPQVLRSDAARLILDRLTEEKPTFFAATEFDDR